MSSANRIYRSEAVITPTAATTPAASDVTGIGRIGQWSQNGHRIPSQPKYKNQNPLRDSRRPHEVLKNSQCVCFT